jgi:DNA-binding IclR family transcriptional regulator
MRAKWISTEERSTAVLRLLAEHPHGLTAPMVAAVLGWPSSRATMILHKLWKDGELDRELGPKSPGSWRITYVYRVFEPQLPFTASLPTAPAMARETEPA